MTEQHPNRRGGERAGFRGTAHLVDDAGMRTVACDNVSEGGACVSDGERHVGAAVRLFVQLPVNDGKLRMVLVDGEVAWSTLAHSGIRFIDPPAESVNSLRTYVRHAA